MSEKKSSASKVGTKQKPHQPGEFVEMWELDPGFSELFVVQENDGQGWNTLTVESTQKKAETEAKRNRKQWLDNERQIQEQNFYRTHQTPQSIQLIQHKITAKTTDKELEQMREQLEEYRKKLKEIPKAPKFKFVMPPKKDRPKYRVSRLLVNAQFTTLLTLEVEDKAPAAPAKKSAKKESPKKESASKVGESKPKKKGAKK